MSTSTDYATYVNSIYNIYNIYNYLQYLQYLHRLHLGHDPVPVPALVRQLGEVGEPPQLAVHVSLQLGHRLAQLLGDLLLDPGYSPEKHTLHGQNMSSIPHLSSLKTFFLAAATGPVSPQSV